MIPSNALKTNQNKSISTATSMYEQETELNIPYFSTKDELLCWGEEAAYLNKLSNQENDVTEDEALELE